MNKKDVACSELALLLEADAKALISISDSEKICLPVKSEKTVGVV